MFNVRTDGTALAPAAHPRAKSHKELQGELAAIFRQLTASVSFLPLLDEAATFELLVYTGVDVGVPEAWEESAPRYISGSAAVALRGFDTSIHKMSCGVSYRPPVA